jgi:tryptophan 7-halogenase
VLGFPEGRPFGSGGWLSPERVQDIAIIGGGAAAWLAAATLSRAMTADFCRIRVIHPPRRRVGPISEVALPSFHRLNGLLGIDEDDLVRRTLGTFRLGEQFKDWGRVGDRYFHAFGALGVKLDAVPFQHYWLKLRQSGENTAIEQYSVAAMAANLRRFAHPSLDRNSVLSFYSYGYHFDAGLLESYLEKYSLAHGVVRVDGEVVDVHFDGQDGLVDALQLEDGARIRADLYIDAAGIEGILHRRVFAGGIEDWRRWLPCDRAVAVGGENTGEISPYAESSARGAGWQWRIPLQHSVDHGYAYCSAHLNDDQAAAALLADLPGAALSQPRFLRLPQGRPAKFWEKNCVLLAGSMFDPLEATGLHLAQTGITRLLTLFPVRRFSPLDIEEYNRLAIMESERIRDFRILHFKATQRRDSPFWEQCRNMQIPDTLQSKVELFKRCGRLAMFDEEHFGEDSWLSLLLGQNLIPQDYDPLADVLDVEDARAALLRMRSMIKSAVDTMPSHAQFIQQHCSSPAEGMRERLKSSSGARSQA